MRFSDDGLIPAIAQDARTGEIRMVAWMTREALGLTLEMGRATFFSRSRGSLWKKGESSGHELLVRAVGTDCDEDVVLLLVEPRGPSCHTGRPSCFFRTIAPDGSVHDDERGVAPILLALEREIAAREASTAKASYTKSLLEAGPREIGAKIREEADEVARAIEGESPARVASEAADVVYHLMVGLRARGIEWADVTAELARRMGTSGHAEKASRVDPSDA